MIEWRDVEPEPDGLPLDWDAFRAERGLDGVRLEHEIELFVAKRALKNAREHGAESPHAEVGGILFGRVYRGGGHVAVDVVEAVPAHGADGSPVHLDFTPEAWESVFARKAELPEDVDVVGWYHTHPGLGVFLSGTDLATQRSFFTKAWQVAMVLDPVARTEGAFLGAFGDRAEFYLYEQARMPAPEAPAVPQAAKPVAMRPWWLAIAGVATLGAMLLVASRRRR